MQIIFENENVENISRRTDLMSVIIYAGEIS